MVFDVWVLSHTGNTLFQARTSAVAGNVAVGDALSGWSGSRFRCCANEQVVHDLFLEDLALAHVISQEQSKAVIKRNRVVEEGAEETAKE